MSDVAHTPNCWKTIFRKRRREHSRCAFDAQLQVQVQTCNYQEDWSTKQKRGSIANTSLSTATCEIHEIHMILIKINVLNSKIILYIPITKAHRHRESISALQCPKHANQQLHFQHTVIGQICKICNNLQKYVKKEQDTRLKSKCLRIRQKQL